MPSFENQPVNTLYTCWFETMKVKIMIEWTKAIGWSGFAILLYTRKVIGNKIKLWAFS